MANKKTPLEQWEQALWDVDDFGKQSPVQAQCRLIAAGERLAATLRETRSLTRLWKSDRQHDTEDNDYADGYNDGLTEAADDLIQLLNKIGHTA